MQLITFILTLDYFLNMSVRDCCQAYRSSSNKNWKHSLGDIITALKAENHPDQERFSHVAITLMMNDKPGYWCWLDAAITKLINDPISRLDAPPDLLDYDQMSCKDLVDKYEINDENYPCKEILTELMYRYPLLIQSDEVVSVIDLRDMLKDVM
jgi:hypothetical protein